MTLAKLPVTIRANHELTLFLTFSDIDNNGYLDKNDFECLAVRTSVIESKGEVKPEKYEQNRKVMRNLWNEIADLADFNKVFLVK